MAKEYTKEQFWKLYEKLPQELKDALFAEETGDDIYDVCKRNEVEEYLGEIVDYVGQVLLGFLTPEDFQNTLEKELNLEEGVAKKVAKEINRFIFYPVKPTLEQLYQSEIISTEKTTERPAIERPEIKLGIPETEEEKPEKPSEKDVYREPIE
jgi:hypothetical protein